MDLYLDWKTASQPPVLQIAISRTPQFRHNSERASKSLFWLTPKTNNKLSIKGLTSDYATNNILQTCMYMYGRYAPKKIIPAAAAERLALEKNVLARSMTLSIIHLHT